MSANSPLLLIVDYNLTRISDVAHIARYAREKYYAQTVLIRPNPSTRDAKLCDHVIDLDPLADDFIEAALQRLTPLRERLRAGVVFSDNAVQRGAALLERLGLLVDSSELAAGAFSKHAYRVSEDRARTLLEAQSVMVPHYVEAKSVGDLQRFSNQHPDGFVVKPSCEGNNRGVVVVKQGDSLEAAFAEVAPYLRNGAICEEFIPFKREFSFDGVGALSFVTEKVSATGRYPVEVAQVLPARLNSVERNTLERTGKLANLLVGQCHGPFHNEVKLSDDGARAAVVEPNRRPGGMKIWSLANWVYELDFYRIWVDSVFGVVPEPTLPKPFRAAATVMLGVAQDGLFSPEDVSVGKSPLADALAATAKRYRLSADDLYLKEFEWISLQRRELHRVPRDNADFAAIACVVLESNQVDIRAIVTALREEWLIALQAACAWDQVQALAD